MFERVFGKVLSAEDFLRQLLLEQFGLEESVSGKFFAATEGCVKKLLHTKYLFGIIKS